MRLVRFLVLAACVCCGLDARAQSTVYVAASQALSPGCQLPLVSCDGPAFYTLDGRSHSAALTAVFDRSGLFSRLAVDPSGRRLYFAQANTGLRGVISSTEIWWTDPETGKTNSFGSVGGGVAALALSRDGSRLYCLWYRGATHEVAVFDTTTYPYAGRHMAALAVGPSLALAVSPMSGRLYVAEADGISVFDATTYARVGRIELSTVGAGTSHTPSALVVSPDGRHVFASMQSPAIVDVDPATNTIAATIAVSGTPGRLALSHARAYALPDVDTGVQLTVIDIATDSIVATRPLAQGGRLAVTADGETLFVQRYRAVDAIDVATLTPTSVPGLASDATLWDIAPVPPAPVASLGIDPLAAPTAQVPFDLTGWAIETPGFAGGPGITTVHAWAYPAGGGAPIFAGADYGQPRPDIAAQFGAQFLQSGYRIQVGALPPGVYTLVLYGLSSRLGVFSAVRTIVVQVVAPKVELVVDAPRAARRCRPDSDWSAGRWTRRHPSESASTPCTRGPIPRTAAPRSSPGPPRSGISAPTSPPSSASRSSTPDST